VGCDPPQTSLLHLLIIFQSTHPRGVRQRSQPQDRPASVFQSTHPRGVRRSSSSVSGRSRSFQSTHPRGVRRRKSRRWRTASWTFNPRTRVGCDGEGCGRQRCR